MTLIALLTDQASNAAGSAVQVGYDEDNPGLARIISVQGYGTWSAATVTLESSNDPTGDEWAPVQYLSSGVMTNLEFTADFILNVHLAPGAGLRARLADSGSPLPSVSVTALGHIASVA